MVRLDFVKETMDAPSAAGAMFEEMRKGPILVKCSCGYSMYHVRDRTGYRQLLKLVKEHGVHGWIVMERYEIGEPRIAGS